MCFCIILLLKSITSAVNFRRGSSSDFANEPRSVKNPGRFLNRGPTRGPACIYALFNQHDINIHVGINDTPFSYASVDFPRAARLLYVFEREQKKGEGGQNREKGGPISVCVCVLGDSGARSSICHCG